MFICLKKEFRGGSELEGQKRRGRGVSLDEVNVHVCFRSVSNK